MPLGGAPSCGLDRISAFEHLQALVANGPDLDDLGEHDDVQQHALRSSCARALEEPLQT